MPTPGTLHPGLPITRPLTGRNSGARLDRSPLPGQLDLQAYWCSMKFRAFLAGRGFLDRTATTLHSATRGFVT